MLIEKVKEEEYFELVKILNYYRSERGGEALGAAEISSLYEAVSTDAVAFYAVKENGNLIAVCSVAIIYSATECTYAGMIENAYVLPLYRKRGLLRRLMEFANDVLTKSGIEIMITQAYSTDEEIAKKLGFDTRMGVLMCRKLK